MWALFALLSAVFAAITGILAKLGMDGTGAVEVLNLKCDPAIIGMLRLKPGFFPAYHMNKEKWVSILLCGPAADNEIKGLIEFSYQLTVSRKKRKNADKPLRT